MTATTKFFRVAHPTIWGPAAITADDAWDRWNMALLRQWANTPRSAYVADDYDTSKARLVSAGRDDAPMAEWR